MKYPPFNDTARIVTDSELFSETAYEIKDGHVIVWTKKNGTLAIELKHAGAFAKELRDVAAVWAGYR